MAFNPNLRWAEAHTPVTPLPSHITRTLIPSPSGPLELLTASPPTGSPPSSPTNTPPLFFLHGGFGSASVWLLYLTYFSQSHNVPCYALSLRGHGQSWAPGFLRMYFTTQAMLAEDVVAGVQYVEEREMEKRRKDVRDACHCVLVGHSSGGGLAQYVLSEGLVQVEGLVLLGSIPNFGSRGVYWNWFKLDPWVLVRSLWHSMHPRSPLSSTQLVKRAFFSASFPDEKVREFETLMPAYESMLWPIGMMRSFVDLRSVLRRIVGWGGGERVFVVAGGGDGLVSVGLCERMVKEYREAVVELVREKKIEAEIGKGVGFVVVEGAGHHLQNDLMWEVGARRIAEFVEGF